MKSSRNLIVVDQVRDWDPSWKNYPVISAEDYVNNDDYSAAGFRVINLCRQDHRLSLGYYTSLLAEARGHRAIPTAKTLQALARKQLYAAELSELKSTVQRSLTRIIQEDFALSVYFGQNLAAAHEKLASQLFNLFPCPLFKVQFSYNDDGWEIGAMKLLGLNQVPRSHRFKVKEAIDAFLSRRWRTTEDKPNTGYDLAILHNPEEAQAPSDARALRNFVKAGEAVGMNVELITKSDFPRLLEFDALFIRETTSLEGHTYRFATKAEREGMIVIDSPDSIRRCCNKVFLHELLRKNRIPMPRTEFLSGRNVDRLAAEFGYPIILKIPDSAFSLGVFKVENENEFRAKVAQLLKDSDLVLAQEFLPTDFDWRIGVLDRKPLFACRYFMSKDHWQIYNHDKKGSDFSGDSETLPIDKVPPNVIQLALKVSNLIGDGLYGVDMKEKDGELFIIEVNDNPNIDSGIEDEFLKHELYEKVMRSFQNRIERSKQRPDSDEENGTSD